ncbi:TetR/AcrR family transcriptional regulator C-terminal domain-containing protein [Kitasatospora sp. CM 4170]|uniref:TetR/AcrR family transcriptional regulator C-terminal domain-containing protein n=1 Tax=Kitasatospora aburaviensis TaxID=67265 RepID=A0ABW1EV21_9ACTN|nr:TetR/AcrR family transcriptional regulator C-terminal domain-containing protein [Kitasatospora sp. CM 4170]WNM49498.1 TetR/AcrR family transcriptional regulator C-terminal domain-containing protein [Kitasatospora sp. CM 4170]
MSSGSSRASGSGSGSGASATAQLLWGPPPKPARGPKPALSLDRIARAGIEIADAEGLGAVSMQRVAGLLDYTKMSLYRYLPGKAELVALMVEAAVGEPTEPVAPTEPSGWRGQLLDWSHHLAAAFAAHPWLLDATVGPRLMGPRELAWLERVVAALDGTGLTGPERMDAAVLLAGHVRSIAEQARAAGPGGEPESELLAALGGLLQEHADRFPALAAATREVAVDGGQDEAFGFGLERILDGLEALITRRSGPAGS